MNLLINELYTTLKEKYGISRTEIERITDSQFKVTEENIKAYTLKDIKWMHLGKIKPSDYIVHKKLKDIKYAERLIDKPKENEVSKEV